MSARDEDYLWDPSAMPDPDIERLERTLRPMSAQALRLHERTLPLPPLSSASRARRRMAMGAAIAACLLLILYVGHAHRLSWEEGAPWPVTVDSGDGSTRTDQLQVGARLATNSGETASVQAARIGTVTVAENSLVTLTRTRTGQHRLELERGTLHAKVWAPPNYFGVTHGDARFIDLGCEFELTVAPDGSGTLAVSSGWIVYRHESAEILVPEQYSLAFDATRARTPVRPASSPAFRDAVRRLDALASQDVAMDRLDVRELVESIAAEASDDDFFTLLSVLVRYPHLAQTPLYTRLASALRIEVDEAHRARWVRGDAAAREEWWQRMPAQPKTWWLKWPDAL